jgi:hypothetical protein
VLYRERLNKFHLGANQTVDERIEMHLDKTFGNKSFTVNANDWEFFLFMHPIISMP